jgi:predicted phage terminase large subunit-like protein
MSIDPVGFIDDSRATIDDQLVKSICEDSLYEFVQTFWDIVEPGRKFVPNWHIEWLCKELEAITRGEQTRLLANVPPGAMKEIHVDEPVLTRRGRIRLGDVVVGDEIMTHRGRYRKVLAVHEKGIQQTLLVTTDAGRKVRAELRHPFLTTRGWIEAKDLRLGDVLAAVTPMEEIGPDLVTPEEARFLGYMVGDGSCTHSPSFTNADEDVLSDIIRCAESLGITATRRERTPSEIARGALRVTIGFKGSLGLLRKHGLVGKDSYTKRAPAAVMRSSNETIANFIGAYWSCDGTIHIRHKKARGGKRIAVCTTVGRELSGDIQHLLLRLGISTRVRTRSRPMETAAQPGGTYWFYHVISESHEETVKFTRLRGLCPRKADELKQLTPQAFDQGPLHEDPIAAIEPAGDGECRCLTVEDDHSFTANDIAVHNSLLTCVFWSAWEWGPMNMAHLRYLLASYTQDLPIRDNRRCKSILNSDLYKRLWPHVRLDPNRSSDQDFGNLATGWRIATSPGGIGTGERADRIVIDDGHSVKTVESDLVRQETLRWWREVIPTRVNDAATSAFVVIMQRVHEEDIAGDILENRQDENWSHICIPMRYEPDRHCVTDYGEDPRGLDEDGELLEGMVAPGIVEPGSPLAERAGELYWPEKFPDWTVRRDSVPLGRFGVAAQFQQLPAPRGGGIVLRSQWQLWPPDDERDSWVTPLLDAEGRPVIGDDGRPMMTVNFPTPEYTMAYADTAFTEKEENAFCAYIVWSVFMASDGRPKVVMRGAWQGRPTLRELCQRLHKLCQGRVDTLVIENKAGAEWVKQEIMRLLRAGDYTIVLDNNSQGGDKVARLHQVTPLFEGSLIYAPDRVWADMVINQVSTFPKGKFKDLVDCCSGGLGYLRRNDLIKLTQEFDDEQHEREKFRGNRASLAEDYGVA